jgi:hypothetical protein
LAGACSLEGLADGSGTTTAAATSSASSSSQAGGGGEGGSTPSPFSWSRSFGNELVQGTSPYGTDAGSGSTLRASEPGPEGDVWIAAATRGMIDPDGAGGFDAAGSPDSANLFLLRVGKSGELLAFRALEGALADLDGALSVGAVVRQDGGTPVVVGTFRGGTIDVGSLGTLSQPNLSQDDAFVVRFDASGEPTQARQFGGANDQTLRAAVPTEQAVVVAGKFKRVLDIEDLDGVADGACAYDQPMEGFERTLVAVLDPDTLACTDFVTFAATEDGAAQQAFAVAADTSGIYVGGSFSRQLIAAPHPTVLSSAGEDGFIAAIEPDLSAVRWIDRLTSNRYSANEGVRALALAGGSLWVAGFQDQGTSAVMGGEPTLGTPDAQPIDDCVLAVAVRRDGIVGRLDLATGACQGAVVLGGAEEDEVRGAVPFGAGVTVTGFTTVGVAGLAGEFAAGSRDGFVAHLDTSQGVTLTGGLMLGGVSWDYVDFARHHDGAILVGGSFGSPFGGLEGTTDFYFGALAP